MGMRGTHPVRSQKKTVPAPDPQWPRDLLLTGAIGFLGAHLLTDLPGATGARVWCLVRAGDAAHARQRIAAAAARYELPEPPGDRVVPLPGDLTLPRLGLSPGEFRDLAGGTDVIYHAGAAVNFIYPYEELRAANVTGTRGGRAAQERGTGRAAGHHLPAARHHRQPACSTLKPESKNGTLYLIGRVESSTL